MTVSTHVYSAYIVGSGEELSVLGGTITLDDTDAPHVQGDLRIAMPVEEVFNLLDPRNGARVRIEVEWVTPWDTFNRYFDLGVRDRQPDYRPNEVTLVLASDEALLMDHKAISDDTSARAYESSLRAVVNHVLGTAIPGESLEPSPSIDANVTRYWALSNRVSNPSAESTSGFSVGANANTLVTGSTVPYHGSNYVGWSSTASGASYLNVSVDGNCSEGDVITAIAQMRTGTAGRTGAVMIRFYNDSGTVLQDFTGPAVTLPATNTWQQVDHTVTAPRGAVRVGLFLVGNATAPSQAFRADGIMLYDGDELVSFFTGSSGMPGSTGYTYAWAGPTSNSASTRTPYPVERDKDSLTWEAGTSALDFLAPLAQAAGFRLVCDEERKWTLRDEEYVVPDSGTVTVAYGVNMVDGSDTVSRDNGDYMNAAVTEYTWTDRRGRVQTRLDSYVLPGATAPLLVRRFEKLVPFPGAGFSEYAVRRAQGRGRVSEGTCVADWRAKAEQSALITPEFGPAQSGHISTLTYDLDQDEMTITIRAVELPAGSIDLLVGTVNALSGTVNSL